ncbi:MAG: MotA/TolQ/ExbB proton channel family protein [Lachnospiraceae bacterium]|nr:MotA/TolQ/ExbB proton channel family protein [Lachnospiraceae bacterium]
MKKRQERILIYVYIAMVMLCLYLNYWTATDIANILVNAGMFLIVGIIFVHAFMCFRDVNKIMQSLDRVSKQIKEDFDREQDLLWESYKEQGISFGVGELNSRYKEYQREMTRMSVNIENGYKCSIEDYINRDVIDKAIDRNMMNLVSGTMTGLGILGTFIGLSFGLHNFNTGTAQEISDSIAPLMEGIKVAFHTSIYGMVFSLCFNYVYKRKLGDANQVMDNFLDVHQKYVMPEHQSDGMNMLLAYQKQLLEEMRSIAERMEINASQKASKESEIQVEDRKEWHIEEIK